MISPEEAKNYFAFIGIIAFSCAVVVRTATLYDKIHLWGWKKGVRKWLET